MAPALRLAEPGPHSCPAFSQPGLLVLCIPQPGRSRRVSAGSAHWGKVGGSVHREGALAGWLLTRVILLCFNHACVDDVFYSRDGYGGFGDVGGNDHFATALKEGKNQKSRVTHTDSQVLEHSPRHQPPQSTQAQEPTVSLLTSNHYRRRWGVPVLKAYSEGTDTVDQAVWAGPPAPAGASHALPEHRHFISRGRRVYRMGSPPTFPVL